MQSHLLVHRLTIVDPFLPRQSKFIGVCFPYELLAALVSEFVILQFVTPYREGSLDIFAAIFNLRVPNGLQSLVLGAKDLIRVLRFPAPHIEHFSQKLFAHEFFA